MIGTATNEGKSASGESLRYWELRRDEVLLVATEASEMIRSDLREEALLRWSLTTDIPKVSYGQRLL